MKMKYLGFSAALLMMSAAAFADVCQTDGSFTVGETYYGNVSCGTGTLVNLNVYGTLILNGTTVQGTLNVYGKTTATNASIQSVIANGDFVAQNSKILGNLESNGAVYLNAGSVVQGQLQSSTGQVFIDSSSSVKGNTTDSPNPSSNSAASTANLP